MIKRVERNIRRKERDQGHQDNGKEENMGTKRKEYPCGWVPWNIEKISQENIKLIKGISRIMNLLKCPQYSMLSKIFIVSLNSVPLVPTCSYRRVLREYVCVCV